MRPSGRSDRTVRAKGVRRALIITVCVTGLALAAVAADKQKPDRPRVATVQPGTGQPPVATEATEATAWIQYDDGTREDWAPSFTIDGGAVGNKFTSSWGTFYCDQASAYMQINSTTGFYLTAYTGLAGGTLQGNDDQWFTYATTYTTATGWFFVNTTGDFLGNTTFVFNNTAWIAAYYSTSTPALPYYQVGIDTSGPDNHGFAVTDWSGSGYSEGSYNAMIRARFKRRWRPGGADGLRSRVGRTASNDATAHPTGVGRSISRRSAPRYAGTSRQGVQLMDAPFTMPFETFWGWLMAHPNCIVRAGTPESVLYDDEDLHWHFAAEAPQTLLVQVLRGKRLLGELLLDPEQIAYVQAVPQERQDEHVFELLVESDGDRFAAYFFALIHGFDDEDGDFSPGRVH